jgi:hypothetical protein
MGAISKEWIVNKMITLVGKKPLNIIKKSTYNPEKHQREFLRSLIENNKNTVFGKDHNFSSIKTYEDYTKNVPIRSYNEFNHYIKMLQKGTEDVLFKGRPALYNTSSGTTGQPKLIPISEPFKKQLTDFNKLWLYSILEQNPGIYKGKSLTSIGKAIEGYTEDGTPIGSISGNSFKSIPKAIATTNSSIYPIFAIDDYDLRYYAISRNALEHDITLSICASLANLIRYHQTIMENFDQMVEEIRYGKINEKVLEQISEEDRKDVLERISPNPERADELLALKAKYGDNLLPKHYWPNLKVINAWVQGNFSIMVKRLKKYFPVTSVIRSFGYQASEGRFGISLDNHWHYSLLIPTQYFYEFIPFENIEDKNPPTKMYHELELDKRYYVVISNISGLYRYDMNDIIEVVGFYNKCPLVKFVQKGAGIVNIMGEKLSEEQVIDSTKKAAAETGLTVRNFVMYGNYKDFKYEFFAEFAEETSDEQRKSFIENVDKNLQNLNIEYDSKRKSKRLSLPDFILLPYDSHLRIKQILVEKKLAKDGQFKDLYLTAKIATREVLEEVC